MMSDFFWYMWLAMVLARSSSQKTLPKS